MKELTHVITSSSPHYRTSTYPSVPFTRILDLPPKSIGQVGGGIDKRTGIIDVGIIQSLSRKGEVKDLVAEYGQVIIDECHHRPDYYDAVRACSFSGRRKETGIRQAL